MPRSRTVRLPCGCTEFQTLDDDGKPIRHSIDELCEEHEAEAYWEGVAERRAEERYERTGRRY